MNHFKQIFVAALFVGLAVSKMTGTASAQCPTWSNPVNMNGGIIDNTFTGADGGGGGVSIIAVQPDGKILIGGYFTTYNGTTANRIARLNADGTIDNTFTGTGANSVVSTIAVQPDGKILIGGVFTTYNGVTKNGIVRINNDGTIDPTFSGTGTGGNTTTYIATIAVQPDGKILIGGYFPIYNGVAKNHIARLNADGTIDNTFTGTGAGGNSAVQSIALQPDGKILIGGSFTTYNGVAKNGIARLNANGTLDNTFTGTGANNGVYSIALQSDGKILIGGFFTTYNGVAKNCIVRLNADGSIDNTFTGTGANNGVSTIALQPDGKILIGGFFTSYNGVGKLCIVRLNANGTLDNTFTGTGANNSVFSIALQPDGKILIGGSFTQYNGVAKNFIVRLNADGTIDNTFTGTGANDSVQSIALQPDGKILIGGNFTQYNGVAANRIARISDNISVPDMYCAGAAIALSSPPVLNNNGSAITSQGWYLGGSPYTPGTPLSAADNGKILVYRAENGCGIGESNEIVLEVNSSAPATAGTLSGNQVLCEGATVIFGSTVSGGLWSSDEPGIAAINPSSGVITGVSAGTAIMTYTVTNGCGATTETRTVNVQAPTAGTLSGNTEVCAGASITLSSTVSNGVWSSNEPNIAIIDPSLGVITGISAGTATIVYTVTNACGTYQVSQTVTVKPFTPPVISANGSTLFTDPSYTSYQWALNGTVMPTETSYSLTAIINGNYTVTVTSANGCSGTSPIFQYPPCTQPVPTITANGNTLTATAGFVSYQWAFNGSDIPGATNQTYEATQDGDYTVRVEDGNGCLGTSAPYTHEVVGLENIFVETIKIYPNPTNSMVNIESDIAVNVTVYGMDGKIIVRANDYSPQQTIDLSHVSAGVYMVKISDENGGFVKMERIVVEK
jgi:uncharacterized delta-60 repeat protein